MGIFRKIFHRSTKLTASIDQIASESPALKYQDLEKVWFASERSEKSLPIELDTLNLLQQLTSNNAIPEEIRTFISLFIRCRESESTFTNSLTSHRVSTIYSETPTIASSITSYSTAELEEVASRVQIHPMGHEKAESCELGLDTKPKSTATETHSNPPQINEMAPYSLTIPRLQVRISHWLRNNCINLEAPIELNKFVARKSSNETPKFDNSCMNETSHQQEISGAHNELTEIPWVSTSLQVSRKGSFANRSCNSYIMGSVAPSLISDSNDSSSSQASRISRSVSSSSSYSQTWGSESISRSTSDIVPFAKPRFRSGLIHRKNHGSMGHNRSIITQTPNLGLQNPNKYIGHRSMSGPYPCITSKPVQSNEFVERNPRRQSCQMPPQLPYRSY